MKLPKHPLKKYPKNKTLYNIYRGKGAPKASVCEHGRVGYNDLVLSIKRSILIISRLSKCLAEMEDKFSETKETVEYITERAEHQIKQRNAIIAKLQQRLEDKVKNKNGRLN
jgi:hypothetical protein